MMNHLNFRRELGAVKWVVIVAVPLALWKLVDIATWIVEVMK